MIIINADGLQDGLYNVKDGQIFKYKANGGTVRTYEMGELVRCKDCKHRHEDECPMQFEEEIDIDEGDGYYDTEYIIHDYTRDDGYCSWGERRTDD
jgi:hypothetical protein